MIQLWTRRVLVAIVVGTGLVVTSQVWTDADAGPTSGTWWLTALALVALVSGVLAVTMPHGTVAAGVALMAVCVAPGFYPLNAVVLVWGVFDVVRALAKPRPAKAATPARKVNLGPR